MTSCKVCYTSGKPQGLTIVTKQALMPLVNKVSRYAGKCATLEAKLKGL